MVWRRARSVPLSPSLWHRKKKNHLHGRRMHTHGGWGWEMEESVSFQRSLPRAWILLCAVPCVYVCTLYVVRERVRVYCTPHFFPFSSSSPFFFLCNMSMAAVLSLLLPYLLDAHSALPCFPFSFFLRLPSLSDSDRPLGR